MLNFKQVIGKTETPDSHHRTHKGHGIDSIRAPKSGSELGVINSRIGGKSVLKKSDPPTPPKADGFLTGRRLAGCPQQIVKKGHGEGRGSCWEHTTGHFLKAETQPSSLPKPGCC